MFLHLIKEGPFRRLVFSDILSVHDRVIKINLSAIIILFTCMIFLRNRKENSLLRNCPQRRAIFN